MKPIYLSLVCGSLFLAGCVTPNTRPPTLPVVPGNPFDKVPPTIDPATLKQTPDSEIAAKVYLLGRDLLAKNPQLQVPSSFKFCTIDKPCLEIFHLDDKAIYVTEGLVKRCRPNTDDLVAVLAQELGKISAELLASTAVNEVPDFERRPPIAVDVGNDRQIDMTNQAQFLKYENARKVRQQSRPNPRFQAQCILENAGYSRSCLDKVRPLLEEADRNCALERQVKGLPQQNGWGP